MAEAAEPELEEPKRPRPSRSRAHAAAPSGPPRSLTSGSLMALGVALVLAIGGRRLLPVAALRRQDGHRRPPSGGPSLEHATRLFREGKIAETIAELRRIPAEHPDYARAQKLLASLTRRPERPARRPAEPPAAAAASEAAPAGPPAEALPSARGARRPSPRSGTSTR